MPWICIGSTMICPTVKRGFSDAYGFWKMIWMRRLYCMNSRRRHRQQIAAFEDRLAGRRLMQPHQRQADGRLAGARFADQAERLAFRQLERHVLHRLELALAEEALARIEALAEIAHVEHDLVVRLDAALAVLEVRAAPAPWMKSSMTGSRIGRRSSCGRHMQQRLRVRVLRRFEHRLRRTLLADLAVAHHDDVVGDLADDARGRA